MDFRLVLEEEPAPDPGLRLWSRGFKAEGPPLDQVELRHVQVDMLLRRWGLWASRRPNGRVSLGSIYSREISPHASRIKEKRPGKKFLLNLPVDPDTETDRWRRR